MARKSIKEIIQSCTSLKSPANMTATLAGLEDGEEKTISCVEAGIPVEYTLTPLRKVGSKLIKPKLIRKT